MAASRAAVDGGVAGALDAVNGVFDGETGDRLAARFERPLGLGLALTAREAKARLTALKKFYVLKISESDFDATRLSPPPRVDEAWHLHVLDTKHYSADCVAMCGRVIHHDPDGGVDASTRDARLGATKVALVRVYGDRYDKTIWAWPTSAPPRMRAAPRSLRPRAAVVEDDVSINIRIRLVQTGEETFFKVKRTTKLDKVFNAYSQRKGVAISSLRFLFNAQRVRGDQTVADIDMDDGDELDCMLECAGC